MSTSARVDTGHFYRPERAISQDTAAMAVERLLCELTANPVTNTSTGVTFFARDLSLYCPPKSEANDEQVVLTKKVEYISNARAVLSATEKILQPLIPVLPEDEKIYPYARTAIFISLLYAKVIADAVTFHNSSTPTFIDTIRTYTPSDLPPDSINDYREGNITLEDILYTQIFELFKNHTVPQSIAAGLASPTEDTRKVYELLNILHPAYAVVENQSESLPARLSEGISSAIDLPLELFLRAYTIYAQEADAILRTGKGIQIPIVSYNHASQRLQNTYVDFPPSLMEHLTTVINHHQNNTNIDFHALTRDLIALALHSSHKSFVALANKLMSNKIGEFSLRTLSGHLQDGFSQLVFGDDGVLIFAEDSYYNQAATPPTEWPRRGCPARQIPDAETRAYLHAANPALAIVSELLSLIERLYLRPDNAEFLNRRARELAEGDLSGKIPNTEFALSNLSQG